MSDITVTTTEQTTVVETTEQTVVIQVVTPEGTDIVEPEQGTTVVEVYVQGPQGIPGDNGLSGENGQSAYEIALENGFVGTEAQWLASLVGPQGPAGPEGDQGPPGSDGADGSDATVNATNVASVVHAASAKSPPVDNDEFPIADSAASYGLKKVLWSVIKSTMFSAWGALISGGTSKGTPVDADAIALMDSADTNATKKLTWADLKATLKTYFDTLYAAMPFTVARFTLQTAAPSAASSGEAKLAIRDIAGFGLAQIRSESGHHVLLPGITDPLLRGAFLSTGTTRQYCNMPGIIAGAGTGSAVNYGGINFTNLASGASSGSPAENYVNSVQLVTSGGTINGYLTWMPFQLPDASYGSGATGSDIFVGVNSSNSATAVDTSVRIPTGQVGAGFHYSTTLSDTNWQFTVRNGSGSNITTTDTGMAFAAQKLYFAMIYAPASGSNTYWFLANMTDGTVASGSTARKHGATAAKEIVLLVTRTTTARNIRCNDFWTLLGGGSVTY